MTQHTGWVVCNKCSGLVYDGTASLCPADRNPHEHINSGVYKALPDSSLTCTEQWRGCSKCGHLFAPQSGTSGGVCPVGGAHDGSTSPVLFIPYIVAPRGKTVQGLRSCTKCSGMFFPGRSANSCPAGGAHTPNSNWMYSLLIAPAISSQSLRLLMQRYAPIVYFHPNEQFFMCGVEWYLNQSQLVTTANGTRVPYAQATLPTPPTDDKAYYLQAPSVRAGNLSSAEALVHAKVGSDGTYVDLQFWFFYAYNGAGSFTVNPAYDTIDLSPFGEHEADWEHVTLRFRTDTLALDSIYMSQHDGGQWAQPSELEWSGTQPIFYASRNGHASYPHAGLNPSFGGSKNLCGVDCSFGLRNDTARGQMWSSAGKCRLITADFLDQALAPPPVWLNYAARWGLIRDYREACLNGVSEPMNSALKPLVTAFPADTEVSGESGPTGPRFKGCWWSSWAGDDESYSPPWLPGSGLAIFHEGKGGCGEIWRLFTDGDMFSKDVQVPGGISENPGVVLYHDKLYCFHQGYNNCGQLWYTVFDGTNWTPDASMGAGLSASPAAVVYNDKLYLFHQGSGNSNQLWYMVYDGVKWSADTPVPVGLSDSPAPVVYNGKIYLLHQGSGNNGSLWCATFDGQNWADKQVPNVGMSATPAPVVFQGKLYCFHEGAGNSGVVYCITFDGQSWGADQQTEIRCSFGVAATMFNDRIYVFHQGYKNDGELWYATSNDQVHWTETKVDGVCLTGCPRLVAWQPANPIPDGTYKVLSCASGKAIDVNGGSTAGGANLIIWPYGGGPNQQWTFTYQGGGYYKITAVHSGLSMDVAGGATVDGTQIIQWQFAGGNNQLWRLVPYSDGSYSLVNKNCGRAIDVCAGATADGTTLIQYVPAGSANQRWMILKP